jgi:predicted permease
MRRRWADRAFSTALLAYPRAFRRRFGQEMRADFHRTQSRTLGTPGTLRTLGTLFLTGLAERWTALVRLVWWPDHQRHLYAPEGSHAMFWDTVRADVRHALRLAAKTPVFTALTVLALALGIGANSAIFAVVNGVLLKPLPYRDTDRLVMVWSNATKEGRTQNPVSPANYQDFRRLNQTLEGLEAYFSFVSPLEVVIDGPSEVTYALTVTPGMFELLGERPALGRAFRTDEFELAVILSHAYWQRRFGGDPAVVGRRLDVSGQAATIIGVMPAGFVFPYPGMLGPSGFTRVTGLDMWVPMAFSGPIAVAQRVTDQQGRLPRAVHWLGTVGRRKAEVTAASVEADLSAIARQLEQAYPDTNTGWGVTVVPALEQTVGTVRPALLVLLAGVGLVLLMAAVNVANLMLARSLSRQKELATRAALGASRGRMVQQSLVESVVLGLTGGVLGLVLMQIGVRVLLALAPPTVPRLGEVTPDLRVVAVTLAVALLTGIFVGLLPALTAAKANPHAVLQEQSRGNIGSTARRRVRAGLVMAEVALAVVLTAGAGLLLRSFVSLLNVDPGFRPEQLLTWQMNIPDRLRTPDERRAFYLDFFERISALPGVLSVGGTTRLPLGSTSVTTSVDIEGRPLPPAELPEVELRRNLHDYFAAMGIPVLRGRGFTAEDGPNAPLVVVINQTMARRLFPGSDPIGQRIRMGPGPSSAWMTIVGIIGDIRHTGLEKDPAPELYVHYLQNPPVAPFIVIRTVGDPAALTEMVRREARAIDKDLPVYDLRTMLQVRSESVAERRFLLLLVGAFGLLALMLAAVGVYGVMSVAVSERTQEVGVRLALGAQPSGVLRMIVSHASRLTLAGIVIGLLLTWPLTPLLESQLFGVRAADPMTLVGVPMVLLVTAIIAALVPARRAMRVDPVQALREQ